MNFLANSSNTGSIYYNQERITAFTTTIQTLIDEMESFKQTHQKLWQSNYDDMLAELNSILTSIEFNPVSADKRFNEMIISKYDNFQTYVYNTDINALDSIKCSTERTKTLRAKRKNVTCPNCGGKMNPSDLGYTCNNCEYSQEHKPGGHSNRTVSNNTKHICKQLDALTGTRKAPANIVKIIDYIIIWLTEPKYIAAWLRSREDELETDKKTRKTTKQTAMQKWIKKYNAHTGEMINDGFFLRNIPRQASSMMNYNVFKLFMDEFYSMLEYTHRCSMEADSSMSALREEDQLRIVKEYAEMNNYRLPSVNETFVDSNGHSHDIGRFFNTLSLYVDSIPVKVEIERMFQER